MLKQHLTTDDGNRRKSFPERHAFAAVIAENSTSSLDFVDQTDETLHRSHFVIGSNRSKNEEKWKLYVCVCIDVKRSYVVLDLRKWKQKIRIGEENEIRFDEMKFAEEEKKTKFIPKKRFYCEMVVVALCASFLLACFVSCLSFYFLLLHSIFIFHNKSFKFPLAIKC